MNHGPSVWHRGTFVDPKSKRTPKYTLSEIAAELGTTTNKMSLLSRRNPMPLPSIAIGATHTNGHKNASKLYAAKNYYDKAEVIAWYKKVTEQA